MSYSEKKEFIVLITYIENIVPEIKKNILALPDNYISSTIMDELDSANASLEHANNLLYREKSEGE